VTARFEPSRRRFLGGCLAGAAVLAVPRVSKALGRTPLGGRIAFHVPWSTASIDPHELHDAAAALFASAIADPVYALDAGGAPYPALAAALPAREGNRTVVRLREGLRTARGAALDGRDLAASIERARRAGAGAVLAQIPRAVPHPDDALAVVFEPVDTGHLAHMLASPLVALLPRRFNPAAPDGTGAFLATPSAAGLTLDRNLNAARGAAFLDGIDVSRADDLRTSLRAFEGEHDDLGWLGLGLHDGRRGAVRFDLGRVAWVVLMTGPDAGSFGLPGVAQRLADAFPPERLAHLGLGPLPVASGDPGWGGPPSDLLTDESSAHLVEIANAVAPILSRPGHEVTPVPVARAEMLRRRARGKATLSIEIVRPLGPSPIHALLSLATAEDPARAKDLARHPPKLPANAPARSLTGTLRVGVLGELRVAGGVIPDLVLARSATEEGWDLGASFRKPPAKR
jgi:peptide/nickel transport system substrate-binding protein